MLTEDTTNAFMIIEACNDTRADEMDEALDELAAMIRKELGGTVTKHIAKAAEPEIEL